MNSNVIKRIHNNVEYKKIKQSLKLFKFSLYKVQNRENTICVNGKKYQELVSKYKKEINRLETLLTDYEWEQMQRP